jgi:hypothetical protein
MEQHEAFDPADIGFLVVQGIVLTAQRGADAVEQAGWCS